MSFASDLFADLDSIRAIPGDLGLRPYSVALVTRTWTGDRPGAGTATLTRTPLLVAGQNPKVEQVSQQDIVAGGYSAGDFKVGRLTPPFPGGGYALTDLDPPQDGTTREVWYEITGPAPATTAQTCEKVGEDADGALGVFVILRAKNFT